MCLCGNNQDEKHSVAAWVFIFYLGLLAHISTDQFLDAG